MKFLKEVFSNPDGSGSSKRVIGGVLILTAIITGCIGMFFTVNTAVFDTVFIGFLTAGMTAFGMSSFDTNTYFSNLGNKNQSAMPNMPNMDGFIGSTNDTTNTTVIQNMEMPMPLELPKK